MQTPSKQQHHSRRSIVEPEVNPMDDGGSGLFVACESRFPSPDFEVKCDARHTVWVKLADGSRSVGLPPWILLQHPLEELMNRTAEKLRPPVVGASR